jgi:uncharacterized membrane protein
MTQDAFLFLAAFLASAVEMVEALTIVLAVGITRGWRSTLLGTGSALVLLAGLTAAFGPALASIPIEDLQLVVGGLLLVFGLQWLRKAILRASGYKALHDEEAIYEREREEALRAGRDPDGGIDWYSFALSFKSVFLEGLEVVFIVITFGASRTNGVALAAAAAAAALLVVVAVGALVHAPLSRVPENSLKFAVGLLLTTFGSFWATEGAGASWPAGDAALILLLAFFTLASFAAVRELRRRRVHSLRPGAPRGAEA